jgi:hypothetical protein
MPGKSGIDGDFGGELGHECAIGVASRVYLADETSSVAGTMRRAVLQGLESITGQRWATQRSGAGGRCRLTMGFGGFPGSAR